MREDPEGEGQLRVEAREDGPVVLLVRFVDLFDDLDAQVQLVHEVAGRSGDGDGVREVHLHQPL